ncbi:MAG TPA: hypothetical protein VM847_21155 [Tahibacter sp.]|nr:hypothetical protein [Tahibacter sp.]
MLRVLAGALLPRRRRGGRVGQQQQRIGLAHAELAPVVGIGVGQVDHEAERCFLRREPGAGVAGGLFGLEHAAAAVGAEHLLQHIGEFARVDTGVVRQHGQGARR